MFRHAPTSTLFPYTTLFRSEVQATRRGYSHTWERRLKAKPRDVQTQFGLESPLDRKSTRLNSSHVSISYAVFCLKKKKDRPTKIESAPTAVRLRHQLPHHPA